jgi:transcriptional regulator with XRE-family HTH domain
MRQGNPLPPELMKVIGTYLRQGRKARRLSLAEAANSVGLPVIQLEKIENGVEQVTDLVVQGLVVAYGEVNADKVDGLLFRWAMDRIECESKAKKRKHLSIVGPDPKPWERP